LKSRTRGRVVKMFGKYFMKDMPRGSKEYERWVKEGTDILYDVKTDQDLLDFFCKLKKLELKGETAGVIKYFYVPELNKTEAAIITVGHHSCHDGVT
jgi:uncharacterized protein (UPF0264 family)